MVLIDRILPSAADTDNKPMTERKDVSNSQQRLRQAQLSRSRVFEAHENELGAFNPLTASSMNDILAIREGGDACKA